MLNDRLREQVKAHDEARVKFAKEGVGPMIEMAMFSALQKARGRG